MKTLLLVLIMSALHNCSPQKYYPSPGSRDYATIKKVSSGWQVTTRHPFKRWTRRLYECEPVVSGRQQADQQ